MKLIGEELIEQFNGEHLTLSNPGPFAGEFRSAVLRRTNKFELELEISSPGWAERETLNIPEGSFYEATDVIEFSNIAETLYKASGIIKIRNSSKSTLDGIKTTYTYIVHEMEMHQKFIEEPSYIIEWVGNLSSRLIGNSNLHEEDFEESKLQFGADMAAISMTRSRKFEGSSRILHIRIDSTDLYIVNLKENELQKEMKSGYIVYGSCIDSKTRTKMRECISFVIGLPIIVFGYTKYSSDGMPLHMKSFPARSFGGRAFELTDQPPYPIASGTYRNSPNIAALEKAVNSLYHHYDELKFNEMYWTYWHGACAAATMSSVYFGGLCEQLSKVVMRARNMESATLINKRDWPTIERALNSVVDPLDLEPTTKKILRNKLSNLNQLPQSVALDRMLTDLGLSMSEVERSAWRQRNSAAHGGTRGSSDEIILNSRLLRLMFHRILAALTSCSDYYIDYYSLRFPIRHITDEIPPRPLV